MKSTRTALLVTATLLASSSVLAPPTSAQAVNIDFGAEGQPGPPPGYRGVGLPGHWNSFPATDWGLDYALIGLDGQPLVATVHQIGGTEIVADALDGAADPRGSDAVLLGDALVTHTEIENCLFFEDLENGSYEVITYAWMPTSPTTSNRVHIDTSAYQPLIGGAWTGWLEEGVVYARHVVDVSAGWLRPHSGVPSGGDFGIGAALNGIQIRKLEVEPPLFATDTQLEWLSSLNAFSYDVIEGDLTALVAGGGDFSTAVTACLADNTPARSAGHGPDPAPGAGKFFLVRGVALGGQTWDAPGEAQLGSRDAEIAAAVAACP